ncbi:TIR domain-containing protein [Pseudomonas cedrina]|uniref:TIR domain-containing protein n=1 Tax=Pseudomonas cedrina TaxID=651740 RepID=UPI003EDAC621
MSLQFLKNNYDRVSYLVNLLTSHATGKPADDGEFKILRQKLLNDPQISDALPAWLRLHSSLDSFWGFIQPKFSSYAERRTYLSQQFTPLLDSLEFQDPIPLSHSAFSVNSGLNLPQTGQPSPLHNAQLTSNPIARNKRNVFIVHGRDNETKQEVSRFIEALGLKAIILHEQASAGMTIIEKIERYSNDADFALVLYTPCDLGRGMHESNPPKKRARQNVIFEHGYLMAKLGRENVCALLKGEVEAPNDISGVVYVGLDSAGAWKAEVAKELRECGYQLKQWY